MSVILAKLETTIPKWFDKCSTCHITTVHVQEKMLYVWMSSKLYDEAHDAFDAWSSGIRVAYAGFNLHMKLCFKGDGECRQTSTDV